MIQTENQTISNTLNTQQIEDLPRDSSYVPKDGPFPEMYEPVESPVANVLHPNMATNPCLKYPRVKSKQPIGTVKDFPYVLMTSSTGAPGRPPATCRG